ncbi:MAG: hypothetical protein HC769_31805 [Cyanobacteria bacterium CRU_2_1]|nr:hypothetical protein [Cyanobacteria bacterium RU_5_0]NJR62971.1 hypothetical protein [Cyanobacteria bacterium CRU_2_1]
MEPLAYLHLAQDYDDPEGKEFVWLSNGLSLVALNWLKLSSRATIGLLTLLSTTWVSSLTEAALAAKREAYAGGGYFYVFENGSSRPSDRTPMSLFLRLFRFFLVLILTTRFNRLLYPCVRPLG